MVSLEDNKRGAANQKQLPIMIHSENYNISSVLDKKIRIKKSYRVSYNDK
jgi:hypothetical protein